MRQFVGGGSKELRICVSNVVSAGVFCTVLELLANARRDWRML